MKIRFLTTLAVIVVLVAAVIIGGCTAPDQTETTEPAETTEPVETTEPAETTSPAETTKPVETTEPTKTTSPAETTEPQYGGTVVMLQTTDLNSFYVGEQSGPEDGMQSRPAMETLVVYAEDGTLKPWLAEEIIQDAEANTITVKVRQNVKFHDGTLLDAAAVKWNLEQWATNPRYAPNYMAITSMDVVDEHTLCINFSKWNSYFLSTWIGSNIMSPTSFEQNGIEWCRTHCIGTGPFKLVSFERDVKKEFERFDDYWRGKPRLDKVEILIVPDPMVQVSMLLSGQADLINGVTYSDAEEFKNNPDYIVSQSIVNKGIMFLAPNSIDPDSPFAKLEVRQALGYAIDTKTITDAIYKGYGDASNQLGHEGIWCYNPSVAGYPYDPDKATDLLNQAGYGDGFTANLYCRSEADIVTLTTAVADYLSKVGININVSPVDQGQYMMLMIMQGWSDGILMAGIQAYPDAQLVMNDFSSFGHVGFSQSMAHFDDYDEMVAAAIAAPDFDTKVNIVQQLQTILIDKYALITPIAVSGGIYLKSAKLHDEYTCVIYEQPDTFADAWKER